MLLTIGSRIYLERTFETGTHLPGLGGKRPRSQPLPAPYCLPHPPGDKISFTDDLINLIDPEKDLKDVDLVGITVLSTTALRAYQIADAYRKKGTTFVLGGIHSTAVSDEAIEQADAVVIGEADQIWPQLVKDFQREKSKDFYRQDRLTDLAALPIPRRDIHGSRGYFPLGVVQATRKCPYRCEFCSGRTFFRDTFRLRPLKDVIPEIKGIRQKLIMFNDDNIIGHPRYSRELLQAPHSVKKEIDWAGLPGRTEGREDHSFNGPKRLHRIAHRLRIHC